MLVALIPVVVAIVGLLLWVLAANGKVADAGRILFAVGACFVVAALAHVTVRLP